MVSLAALLMITASGLCADSSPRRGAVLNYADPDTYSPVLAAQNHMRARDGDSDDARGAPEELNGLGLKPLSAISIDIQAPAAELPQDVAAEVFARAGDEWHLFGYSRPWYGISYAWTAPALAYRPLYFQDVNLERYGHHHGVLQPAVSAIHFFGRIPAIPYMRGATPSHECVFPLGYYRPGDCAPHFFSRPRPSLRGALFEGAAATGLVFLIP